MLHLYGHELSGNSYKVRLMLSLLGLEYTWHQVDLLAGAHKQKEFLALNPFGQVPVLVDDTIVLTDAQAILVYLARQYGGEAWLPLAAEPMSRVIRWLAIAASEVRQGPEAARLYYLFKVTTIDPVQAQRKAEIILHQLEQHLSSRTWLELERPTIADLAVFPYVALAADGQIDLQPYPQVRTWIGRVQQLPGFVGMVGLAAPAA
ncbi:MAG: glutathione S-transferase [Gloeomargaritaceae cyanobacterium C42_A2020_066]|nr:glutathione S-transferase [Gloeomargaritaceae cyanobacterium C42_A2020_066]